MVDLSLPRAEQGVWPVTGMSVITDKFQAAFELLVLGKGECLRYIIIERCISALNLNPKEAVPLGVMAC